MMDILSRFMKSLLPDSATHKPQRRHSHRTSHQRLLKRSASPREILHREDLKDTAQETIRILPRILENLGTFAEAKRSVKYNLGAIRRLDPQKCPQFQQPVTINVVNDDTFNAAIYLTRASQQNGDREANGRTLVINLANGRKPGGGWRSGVMAQEESLCYRSSLALSLESGLDSGLYPLSDNHADLIYSPYVVILRQDFASGHHLMRKAPADLPVVSAVSVAGIYKPPLRVVTQRPRPGQKPKEMMIFDRDIDRRLTKDKMRLVLRTAAHKQHHRLVLGALGCGVYKNPPEDVAHCWLEVLRELEFSGHWWSDIYFAVHDPDNNGNYEAFRRVLHGQRVGLGAESYK